MPCLLLYSTADTHTMFHKLIKWIDECMDVASLLKNLQCLQVILKKMPRVLRLL